MPRSAPVLADTAYWLALLIHADTHHARAAAWHAHTRRFGWRLITTDWILAELVGVATVRAPDARRRVVEFIEALPRVRHLEVVHVAPPLRQSGWELLRAAEGRLWSWVDAVSFALMRERETELALTSDAHFIEAGFRRLLLEDPLAHV